MRVPETVLRTLDLNAATAALELARVREQLDQCVVASSVGRRLRVRREQLTNAVEAWELLAQIARAGETELSRCRDTEPHDGHEWGDEHMQRWQCPGR